MDDSPSIASLIPDLFKIPRPITDGSSPLIVSANLLHIDVIQMLPILEGLHFKIDSSTKITAAASATWGPAASRPRRRAACAGRTRTPSWRATTCAKSPAGPRRIPIMAGTWCCCSRRWPKARAALTGLRTSRRCATPPGSTASRSSGRDQGSGGARLGESASSRSSTGRRSRWRP